MKFYFTLLSLLVLLSGYQAHGQIIISQYIEACSGTAPKGIELWNTSGAVIDFSVDNLNVSTSNGNNVTINTGMLGIGEVLVIGTSNMDEASELPMPCAGTIYATQNFTFNGDDQITITLDGVITDVFGNSVDPGTQWSANGVSTANGNIQLKSGITTGDTDGWTDPSERFEQVNTDCALTGFGTPPAGCPTTVTCDLSLTAGTATCDANTAGTDTYTATFTYTDTDGSGTYTVSSSTGTPNITSVVNSASGTITVTGVNEGTDVTITFTDGADCVGIMATVLSPTCVGAEESCTNPTGTNVFYESDFANSNGGWTGTGDWEYGTFDLSPSNENCDPSGPGSGGASLTIPTPVITSGWATNLDGCYSNSTTSTLCQTFDLSAIPCNATDIRLETGFYGLSRWGFDAFTVTVGGTEVINFFTGPNALPDDTAFGWACLDNMFALETCAEPGLDLASQSYPADLPTNNVEICYQLEADAVVTRAGAYINSIAISYDLTGTVPQLSWTPPTANIDCTSGTLDLTTLLDPGTITNGVWSGTGVTGTNFNPVSATAGTYTLTYTAPANCECLFYTADVTVDNNCPIPVSMSIADPCNCANSITVGGVTYAQETITITPGMAPYTVTAVTGLFDVSGVAHTSITATAAISGTTLVAYVPADASSTYSITIEDDNATTAMVSGGPCAACTIPTPPLSCTGTTIAAQDFEGAVSDTWTISAGAGNISSDTGSSDTPANERICSGSNSWQVNNTTGTLELADIDVSGYEDVTLSFRVTSTSTTGTNGNDGADEVSVYINMNGQGFPATADLELEGNNNARWGCDASLTATATAGMPVVVSAPQGGTNTNNYATVTITIPNEIGTDCTYTPLTGSSCRTIGLQIVAMNNAASEIWNIDNIILCGTPVVTDALSCVCAPSAAICTDAPFDLTVCALTTSGNIDPSYNGTISLTNASLSGTTNMVTTCGCAEFSGLSSNSTTTETIMVSGTGGITSGSHMITFESCLAPLPDCPANNVVVMTSDSGTCDYYQMTVTHDHPSPATVAGSTYFIFIGGDVFGPYTYTAANPQSAGPFTSTSFVGDGTADVEVAIGNIVINEIHADPDATTGDANGDGVVDSGDDEFVEIVNYTCGNVDISGYIMTGASHTFTGDPGSGFNVLAPGQAAVVFGGGTPTGFGTSGALVVTASGGSIGLTNSGELITLSNNCGTMVASHTYGSEAGNNQSITRDDDVTGSFVQHNSSSNGSTFDYSPGYLQDAVTPFGYASGCDGTCTYDEPNLVAPAIPNVIISEIQTDPGSGDANAGEWLELLCSSGTCDISGFYVTNGEFLVVIPDGTVLSAGEYYTIGSNETSNGMINDPLNHDLSANGGYSHDLDVSACSSCNCTDGVWEEGNICGGTLISDITLDNAAEQLAIFTPCDLSNPVFAVAWGGGEGLPIAKDIPPTCGGSTCPTAQQITFPLTSDLIFYDHVFGLPANSTSSGSNETGCTTSYSFNGSTYILDDTPTPGLINTALAYNLTINGVTYEIGALERLEDEEAAILASIGSVLTVCDGDEISVMFSQIDNQTLAPNMGMLISGTNSTGPAMIGGYGSGLSFGSSTTASDLGTGLTQTVTSADDGMFLYIRIVELGYQTSVGGDGIGYLSNDCVAYGSETGMSLDCIFELAIEIDVIEDVAIAIDQSACPGGPFRVNILSGTGPFDVTGTGDDASNMNLTFEDNIAGLTPGSSYTITVTDANGCTTTSSFTVDPDCTSAILPVEFLAFTAEAKGRKSLLEWTTVSEINNSHFEIEWSTDGLRYDFIGNVEGQGSSSEQHFYSFVHNDPSSNNYYRLKQVDYNGNHAYSEVKQVSFKDDYALTIRPNITSDKVIIEYSSDEVLDLNIYDLQGRFFYNRRLSSGENIDMNAFPQGTYVFKMLLGNEVLIKRVVKN